MPPKVTVTEAGVGRPGQAERVAGAEAQCRTALLPCPWLASALWGHPVTGT